MEIGFEHVDENEDTNAFRDDDDGDLLARHPARIPYHTQYHPSHPTF